AMVSIDANDFRLENITLRNTTPKGGSQAEALRVHGDRCVIRNADFSSLQDTLMLNGRVYVDDCYIEGDVDFVWGTGMVYFNRCELKALNKGYLVQSRNDASHHGYVFVDCRLTTAPGVSDYILARIEADRFPFSEVAFIRCAMANHIAPVGWIATKVSDGSHIRFLEFGTTSLDGHPSELSQRLPLAKQLTKEEAANLADVVKYFGGWDPRTRS
ncbi:MAG TPA: pectinesterase family protein, partial [Opitutaceae bacterium]|nr:pectinesterase family protein [Opitutaceae bacterium]